jgi:hypothetical protein
MSRPMHFVLDRLKELHRYLKPQIIVDTRSINPQPLRRPLPEPRSLWDLLDPRPAVVTLIDYQFALVCRHIAVLPNKLRGRHRSR